MAPVFTAVVQSSHTGVSSLALFVTSTLYSASAGMRPMTDRTQMLIWSSADMGVSKVMEAPVTFLAKTKVWTVLALPSLAVMVRV